MKRFLFTALFSNDLGLPTRTVPIAAELAKRGHHVGFCSWAPTPSQLILEAGFDNLVPNLRSIPEIWAPSTTEVWNVDHFSALTGNLDENWVRGCCQAFMELAESFGADAIVDSWNLSACLAARVIRKPLVSVIQADMHPQSQGFVWWKEPPSDVPSVVPVLNKVLAEYGLDAVADAGELHVGDLTLVVGTRETDPLPETAEVTYIGPMLWQRPDATLPDWVDSLRRDRPLVWIYSGNPSYGAALSWADSAIVLSACMAALGPEDVQVVLTSGYHALPEDLPPLPANFHYESYVPGLAMAERADLLIHHGGQGACFMGPYSNTPAVIIPTYSERESNARRIAAAGAAEIVLPVQLESGERQVPVEELREKVWRVLSNRSYAEAAGRLGGEMRGYGGPAQAARLIDDFVSTA